jgi:hypothetical protein
VILSILKNHQGDTSLEFTNEDLLQLFEGPANGVNREKAICYGVQENGKRTTLNLQDLCDIKSN